MSCYFRHMKDIFESAGIEITKDNKKDIDRIIHGIVKIEYKNCPLTWKAVKEQIMGNEKAKRQFIKSLKDGLEMNKINARTTGCI